MKFYTPGRESSKSVISTITKEDDKESNKIVDLFRLRKYWNKLKLFSNF